MVKACKNCRYIIAEGDKCPNCEGVEFTDKFNSMIYIFDPVNSEIGKKIGAKSNGKYAVRIKQ